MIPFITPQKLRSVTFSGLLGLLVISCGSYEQASYYDRDGIYAKEPQKMVVTESRTPPPAQQQQGDDFYQDYFGEKSRDLNEYMESEVFTDPNSYSSVESDSLRYAQDSLGVEGGNYFQDNYNDYGGYAGWGDSGSNVSISFNVGWGGGWGWGAGWGWGYPITVGAGALAGAGAIPVGAGAGVQAGAGAIPVGDGAIPVGDGAIPVMDGAILTMDTVMRAIPMAAVDITADITT